MDIPDLLRRYGETCLIMYEALGKGLHFIL